MPRVKNPLMEDKLKKALHIKEPEPYVHPKSRANIPTKEKEHDAPVRETTMIHMTHTVEHHRLDVRPNLVRALYERFLNNMKDARNLAASQIEELRKQQIKHEANLKAVLETIDAATLRVMEIDELMEFISRSQDMLNALERIAQGIPGMAHLLGEVSSGSPVRAQIGKISVSSGLMIEYVKSLHGRKFTTKDVKKHLQEQGIVPGAGEIGRRIAYLINERKMVTAVDRGLYQEVGRT